MGYHRTESDGTIEQCVALHLESALEDAKHRGFDLKFNAALLRRLPDVKSKTVRLGPKQMKCLTIPLLHFSAGQLSQLKKEKPIAELSVSGNEGSANATASACPINAAETGGKTDNISYPSPVKAVDGSPIDLLSAEPNFEADDQPEIGPQTLFCASTPFKIKTRSQSAASPTTSATNVLRRMSFGASLESTDDIEATRVKIAHKVAGRKAAKQSLRQSSRIQKAKDARK